ncbi:MAG TPA: hypothetical protein VN600_03770 [Gemmatimonadaceae bacterium]|jgi:hypothetical protein|nr:hypothetical protein [Gemmatimonadaceae bacterium]
MKTIALVFSAAALAACASTANVASSSGEVGSVTPVNAATLPIGGSFQATLNQSIGTTSSHVGDQFTATVSSPLIASDGETVVPAGATVTGHVTGLHSGSVVGEQSVIRLDFDRLDMNGRSYPFDASVSNVRATNQVNKNGATKGAVTGAAAGAVLGAIISGGELSKIITGGLLGAAAGTVISLGTGDVQAVIPAGSSMTLTSTTNVNLR